MENTSDQKKRHEQFLLERFFETLDIPLQIMEKREAPDFLISVDGRKIGVELTGLYKSHQTSDYRLQINESISDEIVERAKRIYQKQLAPPVWVRVCFSPSAKLKLLDRQKTAKKLSALIYRRDLKQGQHVKWCSEDFDEEQLPREIAFIYATGVPDSKMAHWTVVRAGWTASLKTETLQSRIDEKSKRLPEYQKIAVENWLVIVSDGHRPSQLFDTNYNFEQGKLTSPFSRTFYFNYPGRGLIELGVKRHFCH